MPNENPYKPEKNRVNKEFIEKNYGDTLDRFNAQYLGVVLYGSFSRGDATLSSDLDLLCVAESPESNYIEYNISVAVYSVNGLKRLFESGNLFALHLKTEGYIARDPRGLLNDIFASYSPRESYDDIWEELQKTSMALDISEKEFRVNPYNFIRLARYLTRTASIIKHINLTGKPEFSITQLSLALNEPEIEELVPDRHIREASWNVFIKARDLVGKILDQEIFNEHKTLGNLAEALAKTEPTISILIEKMRKGENFSFIKLLGIGPEEVV